MGSVVGDSTMKTSVGCVVVVDGNIPRFVAAYSSNDDISRGCNACTRLACNPCRLLQKNSPREFHGNSHLKHAEIRQGGKTQKEPKDLRISCFWRLS